MLESIGRTVARCRHAGRVPSPTQRILTPAEVAAAAQDRLGNPVSTAEPLPGGTFGAVWAIELDDGERLVGKAAPPRDVPVLRYERGMLAAEAEYLTLAPPDMPVPRVRALDEQWLFMTRLPGVALPRLPPEVDRGPVRHAAGAAIARLHKEHKEGGTRFGYTGERPHGSTWPEAFNAMIEAILADAHDWQIELPVHPADIRTALKKHEEGLAQVDHPVLLHFDLWDGNILATEDGTFTGLVDGERFLYGDPLVDLVSPALFRDIDGDPFLDGYRSIAPLRVDGDARPRIWLYQLYLYLIMTVEFPSRGESPTGRPERWALLGRLVRDLITRLLSTVDAGGRHAPHPFTPAVWDLPARGNR